MLRKLLLFLALSALAGAQEPVTVVGPILSRPVGPGSYEIKVTVQVDQPLTVPEVPVVSSYLRFVAPTPVPGWLQEDNLLGSLYQVDLNGDGQLSAVEARQVDGQLRIDHLPVEVLGDDELSPQTPSNPDGSPRRYTLGPDAPDFMVLFSHLPMMGLDLQHRGYDPEVESHPNPCLEILVFEPCVGPSSPADLPGEPNFKVQWDQPEHLMFNWEPALSSQWVRSQWAVIPLEPRAGRQEFVFRVSCDNDTNPVGVLAQVNYSLQPGVRCRTRPVLGRLW